jgi:hypothetical protein
MKYLIILITLFFSSCNNKDYKIQPEQIIIEKRYSIFRYDSHARILQVKLDNKILDKKNVRDSLHDCLGFLFLSSNKFVFIDCDGDSYEINPKTGKIKKSKTYIVTDEITMEYLGLFRYNRKKRDYEFEKNGAYSKEDMFQFGGNFR